MHGVLGTKHLQYALLSGSDKFEFEITSDRLYSHFWGVFC